MVFPAVSRVEPALRGMTAYGRIPASCGIPDAKKSRREDYCVHGMDDLLFRQKYLHGLEEVPEAI